MILRLNFYSQSELQRIVERSGSLLGVTLAAEASVEIGRRARGTPRIANRILKRVRDYAEERSDGTVTLPVTQAAMQLLDIDGRGLDQMDRLILETIIDKFHGGPVGVETIAAAIGEESGTVEDVYEPFLLQEGFIARTRRGREATELAYSHLGRARPAVGPENLKLF
jgi:Holliday junction DNA helicase RuvB